MKEITLKSYTLREENGQWLGQIVLTSDGMFASVTDWGNLSYAWRSTSEEDFRKFIIRLDTDYFAGKLQNGLPYIAHSRKTEATCKRFAEKVLPALQKALIEEIDKGIDF